MEGIDVILELLEGKLVTTPEGLFIKVDDLRELSEELKQQKEDEKGAQPPPRSFNEARHRVMADPDWMDRFEELQKPIRQSEADLVKNVTEEGEETSEAA